MTLTISEQGWRADQVVVLDWYDGPRQGVCRLQQPNLEFFFDLLAERPTLNGLDERLFSISVVPSSTVSSILAAVNFAGSPTSLLWVPRWEGDERVLLNATAVITAARHQAIKSLFVMATSDFSEFWGIARVPEFDSVTNWHEYLPPNPSRQEAHDH